MDFLNKLTQKAKETYKEASQKTGELAREAKLRMKMNENKSTINSLYQEIGKKEKELGFTLMKFIYFFKMNIHQITFLNCIKERENGD